MPSHGACSTGAANSVLGCSSRPVEGLPSSPCPAALQVLVYQQQHGLLVDPSLPRVPGHPGESRAADLPSTALPQRLGGL